MHIYIHFKTSVCLNVTNIPKQLNNSLSMLNVPEDSLRYFNEAPKEHEQIAHKPNITYNLVIIHQKALCFWDKCVNMLLKLAMNEANG